MAPEQRLELTRRQREILSYVVGEYVATGQPVGSKHLVEQARLPVSASTVRNELAELEARGLLTHPHTSAGRVPTERGYRFYADELLDHNDPRVGAFPLDLSALRREVDSALQVTTEMLSSVTRLLALVSAPSLETTTVRHVEVLVLQPQTVMVVVITSTGRVTKQVFVFEEHVLSRRVLATLEKRAALLEILGQTLDPRRPFVRVGGDFEHPAFHDVALVGASYGLTNRVLGAVSLLGPVRMDYAKAIRSVR